MDSIFLNGFQEDLQAEMNEYDDLGDLTDRALLLEEKNTVIGKKGGTGKDRGEWKDKGFNSKFCTTWGNSQDKKGVKSNVPKGKEVEGHKSRWLSSAEVEERSKKGLCFKGGDK